MKMGHLFQMRTVQYNNVETEINNYFPNINTFRFLFYISIQNPSVLMTKIQRIFTSVQNISAQTQVRNSL